MVSTRRIHTPFTPSAVDSGHIVGDPDAAFEIEHGGRREVRARQNSNCGGVGGTRHCRWGVASSRSP